MYDHDLQDVEDLGWESFIAAQWESIFIGYRARSGMRRSCRRWSDLIEAGLSCSQELADRLVKAQILDRADRNLELARSPEELVSGMIDVLVDLRAELVAMNDLGPDLSTGLLREQARLLSFVRVYVSGQDAEDTMEASQPSPAADLSLGSAES